MVGNLQGIKSDLIEFMCILWLETNSDSEERSAIIRDEFEEVSESLVQYKCL